jgi:hypothetical protein
MTRNAIEPRGERIRRLSETLPPRTADGAISLRQIPVEIVDHSPRKLIKRMMNRSGNSLLQAVEPLPPDEFFQAGPNGISIAWTIGHLACVMDLFVSWIGPSERILGASIHDVFNNLELRPPGGQTKAAIVQASNHTKADILFLLRKSQVHALQTLDRFPLQRWNDPPPGPAPDNLHTCGDIWEHLAIHAYWHMGELAATLPRFHGTYTLNMLPHYFYYLPADD